MDNQDLIHPNILYFFPGPAQTFFSRATLFLWPDFATGIQNSNSQAEYIIPYRVNTLGDILLSFA